MHKTSDVPESAIAIRTYREMRQLAAKFAADAFNLLAVLGPAGTGKSQALEQVMSGQRHLLLRGHLTPFELYTRIWEHIDEPIIIDDADTLFANPACKPLLKCLCETVGHKRVSWNSAAVHRMDLPSSFHTRSKVAILANTWNTGDGNLAAVADRGLFLHFIPTAREVHEEVGRLQFLADPEVYEFIGQHLGLIGTPSMRYYIKAHDLRIAGIEDWKDKVLALLNPRLDRHDLEVISSLLAESGLTTERERVDRFRMLTGKSSATFYRLRKVLVGANGIP